MRRGKKPKDGFRCAVCNLDKPGPTDSVGTGYAKMGGRDGRRKVCYDCCAELDRKHMKARGRIALYLTRKEMGPAYEYSVGNWPGTLRLPCTTVHLGAHNIAGRRIDVWFEFDGDQWHGVQYGSGTQIVHCKRLSRRTPAEVMPS